MAGFLTGLLKRPVEDLTSELHYPCHIATGCRYRTGYGCSTSAPFRLIAYSQLCTPCSAEVLSLSTCDVPSSYCNSHRLPGTVIDATELCTTLERPDVHYHAPADQFRICGIPSRILLLDVVQAWLGLDCSPPPDML